MVGALSAVLLVAPGRCLFVSSSPSPESWQAGYFEETQGTLQLVSSDRRVDAFPRPERSAHPDALEQPPGTTLLLPLTDAARYRFGVSGPAPTRAPYVVLGHRVQESAEAPVTRPRVPRAVAKHLSLEDWSPSAPWREDRARLAELASACAQTEAAVTLGVESHGDTVELHLGDCAPIRLAADGVNVIASVAGPDWMLIERADGSWPLQHSVRRSLLLSAAFLATLACFALGAWGAWRTLAAAFGVSGLSLGLPLGALLIVIVLALVGFLRIATRFLRHISLRRGAILSALVIVPVLALVLVLPGVPGGLCTEAPPPRAMLLGYSNMAGFGLRQSNAGVVPLMLEACPACEGRLSVQAFPGRDIAYVLEAVRRTPELPGEGGAVVLLAGTNDDVSIQLSDISTNTAGVALRAILGAIRGEVRSRHLFVLMFERVPALVGAQGPSRHEALRSLAREASAQGASFWFIHDFLAMDMDGGAGPVREGLREQRRGAVSDGGGHFIDLLHAAERDMGVSWFSDTSHFSETGLRRVGQLVNQAIVEATPATEEAR